MASAGRVSAGSMGHSSAARAVAPICGEGLHEPLPAVPEPGHEPLCRSRSSAVPAVRSASEVTASEVPEPSDPAEVHAEVRETSCRIGGAPVGKGSLRLRGCPVTSSYMSAHPPETALRRSTLASAAIDSGACIGASAAWAAHAANGAPGAASEPPDGVCACGGALAATLGQAPREVLVWLAPALTRRGDGAIAADGGCSGDDGRLVAKLGGMLRGGGCSSDA